MKPIVEVKELIKNYGSIQALKGVTFTIPKGHVTGFIGPNGAGKTTTMKILLGLLKPDYGIVRVLDLDPWTQGHILRNKLGYLPENPTYPGNVSCHEMLEFVAKLKGISSIISIEREVRKVIHVTGLKEYMNRKVESLSRGYLQRLALAISLIGQPELVILDEPTANLDPIARANILKLIGKIHSDEDMDFIISSHILPELENICDYIIVINNGVILDYGDILSLTQKYLKTIKLVLEIPRGLNIKEVYRDLISLNYVEGVELEEERRIKVLLHVKSYNDFLKITESQKLTIIEERVPNLLKLYSKIVGENIC